MYYISNTSLFILLCNIKLELGSSQGLNFVL